VIILAVLAFYVLSVRYVINQALEDFDEITWSFLFFILSAAWILAIPFLIGNQLTKVQWLNKVVLKRRVQR